MVSFLIPRSHTLQIAECPNQLAVARNEEEPLRDSLHRTLSQSPELVRHRTDSEERHSKTKSANYNSWFKSITSSFMSGGTSPRTECDSPSSPLALDAPNQAHRRARSMVDSCKLSGGADADPRLPDHMRRPELQLRRIQGRDLPSTKAHAKRSSTV